MCEYADKKRKTCPSTFQPGKFVLVKQQQKKQINTTIFPSALHDHPKERQHGNITAWSEQYSTQFISFEKPMKGLSPTCLEGEEDENDET